MNLGIVITGIITGFTIAAPVGPVGVLCMQRALNSGRKAGLVSGLGAATADAFYGCIATLGLTFISGFLINQQNIIRLIGGVFLVFMGIKIYLSHPADHAIAIKGKDLFDSYVSTFFYTLTNPMTIISFAGFMAGVGIGARKGDIITGLLFVLGVFAGSAGWWVILSSSVSLFSNKVAKNGLIWINKISGFVVLGYGIYALIISWIQRKSTF